MLVAMTMPRNRATATDPRHDLSDPPAAISRRRAIGALLALSVATFSYVSVESLPVGLLTLIAQDLDASLAGVGALVTGYAVVVVVASLPLTRLTRTVPQRYLLASLLGVFVVGTLLSAAASIYPVLLAARLLTALSQALFWSVVASSAAGLFPAAQRGRTVAVLFAGSALGPVLGVPAGTWLGQQAGWRTAFLAFSGIGLLTCLAVLFLLPTLPRAAGTAARGVQPDARRYALLLLTTALAVTGSFAGYTYITAFLLQVSGFSPKALAPLLLIGGAAGVLGAALTGALADRHPRAALILPLALASAGWLCLYLAGTRQVLAVICVCATGLSSSALAAAIQSRALYIAPGSTDIASAGSASAYNVGIAAGSLAGGAVLSAVDVRATALLAAALSTTALLTCLSETPLTTPHRNRTSPRHDEDPRNAGSLTVPQAYERVTPR